MVRKRQKDQIPTKVQKTDKINGLTLSDFAYHLRCIMASCRVFLKILG